MSIERETRVAQWTVTERRLVAGVCLVLAAASIAHYVRDLHLRSPAERFVRRFSLDRRRSFEVAAMRLEPSGDLACAVAVDAALHEKAPALSSREDALSYGDVVGGIGDRREELMEARGLILHALAVRPGWPLHTYLLGRLSVELAGLRGSDSDFKPQLWVIPLRQAAAAAPGVDAIAEARGSAYLEMWPRLSPTLRAEAAAALQRAFLDPAFVSKEFGSAIKALNPQQAVRLLPDIVRPLVVASKFLPSAGDTPSVAMLYERILRVEREDLADALRKIEKRDRLGDLEGKRSACWNWLSMGSINDFDDTAGRANLARLLELCPNDQGGSWNADPYAGLVSFFLNGREGDVRGDVLARGIESLAGAPPNVRAQAKILAGDEAGALELARQPDLDPIEWAPFFLDLARFELKQGKPAQARAALEHLSSAVLDDCDVLLVRREVAQALGDSGELQSVGQKLQSKAPGSPRDSWLSGGTLPLCIDPLQDRGRSLALAVRSESPAVVAYGWDGGRSGIISIPRGDSRLRIPLAGLKGKRSLSVNVLAGGPIHPGQAGLEPTT